MAQRTSLVVGEHEAAEKAYEHLSPGEKARILTLQADNVSCAAIGRIIQRDHSTVLRFLQKYESTTKLATAHFEAKADVLARRIVRQADVDQSLEIMDRLDVLAKKRDDRVSGGVQLFIGVKGSPLPAPEVVMEALPPKEEPSA